MSVRNASLETADLVTLVFMKRARFETMSFPSVYFSFFHTYRGRTINLVLCRCTKTFFFAFIKPQIY